LNPASYVTQSGELLAEPPHSQNVVNFFLIVSKYLKKFVKYNCLFTYKKMTLVEYLIATYLSGSEFYVFYI
jgi:hypothetical protein